MLVTDAHIAEYTRDGCVAFEGAFTKWVEPLTQAIERVLSKVRNGDQLEPSGPTYGLRLDVAEDYCGGVMAVGMTPYDRTFRDFIHESPAGEIVGSVMQSEYVRAWNDLVMVKEGADSTGHTQWHSDVGLSPFWGEKIAILWLALTDVAEENAPLVTIPGSHKGNHRYLDMPDAETDLPPGYRPHHELDEIVSAPNLETRSWCMNAGDCLVMHFATLHCSLPRAKGAARRVAWTHRWLGDDVVYQPSRLTKAMDPAAMPEDVLDSTAVDGHRFSFVSKERIAMTTGAPPPDTSFPVAWRRHEAVVA